MTQAPTPILGALVNLHPDRRRPALAVGLGMILLAAAAATFPAETLLLVGVTSGWLLWLAGALMLGVSLVMFTSWLRAFGVIAAAVATGLGLYLTLNPAIGAAAASLFIAAALAMDGSFQLAAALNLRPLMAWRWLLASAVSSLCVAAYLVASTWTPYALALGLGLAFLTTGAAFVATSFARPAPRR
jgi:uncharacterized membrane protein HdeD (DUF308 family)